MDGVRDVVGVMWRVQTVWVVVDGVRDVVWVTWHADGVVVGGGRRLVEGGRRRQRRRLGDVAVGDGVCDVDGRFRV